MISLESVIDCFDVTDFIVVDSYTGEIIYKGPPYKCPSILLRCLISKIDAYKNIIYVYVMGGAGALSLYNSTFCKEE